MSFSRAKLQRFNDVRDSLPSPADYNPKTQERNCSSVFPQTERFSEQQQQGSSHSDSFSIRSVNSSGYFRTPTALKKKKLINTPRNNQSDANLFQTPLDIEAFREKIVECNNKDLYINELIEHMEEMKLQINNFQNKSEILISEKIKCEEKTEQLLNEYFGKLESLIINKNKMIKGKEQFKNIDDLDYLCKTIIKIYQEGLNKKNTVLKDVAASVSSFKKSTVLEMEELKTQYANDLQTINADVLKIITCLKNFETVVSVDMNSNISQLQEQFTYEKTNLQQNYETLIKQLEERYKEANIKTEMQMEEKCKNIELSWQMKLEQQKKEAEDILKECQAISEYNIIQCEVEKNFKSHELTKITKELRNLEQESKETLRLKNESEFTNQNLKTKLDKMSNDLNSLHEQLEQEKENHETYIRQVESDKHMYEVTINKTHVTIEALTKRLFDSDKDVEQLKLELENTELSKLNFEAKCNHLLEDLDNIKKINEDLELQTESTLKMMQEKVKEVQNDLLQKMDLYRKTTEKSIEKMNYKLNEKNNHLQEVMEQLHLQQELNSTSKSLIERAREEIENLEITNNELRLSLTTLQSEKEAEYQEKKRLEMDIAVQLELNKSLQLENEQLTKSQKVDFDVIKQIDQLQEESDSYYKYCEYYKSKAEDYEKEYEQLNLTNGKYNEYKEKYEDLLQKYEELVIKNSQLEKKVAEQESLIGPFREQLQAYELEHRELISRKCNAEAEAKIIGMKYAELMGHQNQKQKIKHMVDLKIKNSTLNETNMQLEQKVHAQAKLIEKLKKNLKGGKENKQNISMNYNLTSSPLRERN